MKQKSDYLYDSVDLDVVEMQVGYIRVKQSKFRSLETPNVPIAKQLFCLHKFKLVCTYRIIQIQTKSLISTSASTPNNSAIWVR